MKFDDHFSGHAEEYSRYRPRYPDALFRWVVDRAPASEIVWDCATGSGQAATDLAGYFRRVFASDASQSQVRNAQSHPSISYYVASAYNSALPSRSIDAVTVAQALHWFEFQPFYNEVQRVLRDSGSLTAWCYTHPRTEGPMNEIFRRFWGEIIGPYWPPERKYVDERYETIPFPFRDSETETFSAEASWTLRQLTGYLRTWSGSKRYQEVHGTDPVMEIQDELTDLWGNPETPRRIYWPIYARSGRM